MRQISSANFTFIHKSFYEYLIAKRIVDDITNWRPTTADKNEAAKQFIQFISKSILNDERLRSEQPIIRFIADHIDSHRSSETLTAKDCFHKLEHLLFKTIEASAFQRDSVATAASNAITILNRAS